MFFIVCFKSEILLIFLVKLKFEPLLASLELQPGSFRLALARAEKAVVHLRRKV